MKLSRAHHYFFAHRLLPKLFHEDAPQFFALLQRDGLRFLEFWWRQAGDIVPPEERLSADGLGYVLRPQPDSWLAAVVIMPPPQGMTEAYFVALFYQERTRTTRVFTLEKGVSLDPAATPLTVFCEWTADNVHRNMGPGPEPVAGLFLAAAASHLHFGLIGGEGGPGRQSSDG